VKFGGATGRTLPKDLPGKGRKREAPPLPSRRADVPLEQPEYLVEQRHDVGQRPADVEQVRHGAERRAEQPTGRVGIDVEY